MAQASNLNDTSEKAPSTSRLAFGSIVGITIGAILGYVAHRKFPAVGTHVADSILSREGIVDPESSKRMGAYYLSLAGAAIGGFAGLFISNQPLDKSR